MIARKLQCLVALLALSGCSAPPGAPSSVGQVNAPDSQSSTRPIQGSCQTTFTPPVPVGPFQVRIVVDGICQVSHLGRTAVHIDQIVTFNPDGSGDSVATAIYTAADGDQLRTSGTTHTLAANSQGLLLFSGSDTFTGGTGRFATATGTASIADGFASLPTLVGGYTFTGTITY